MPQAYDGVQETGEEPKARFSHFPKKPRCNSRAGDQFALVVGYEFVAREKAHYAVVRLCRVLGVSPSG